MLVAAAAVVCVTCAALGSGSFFALTAVGQSVAFLMMALSALVFFGAFDAYEGAWTRSGPGPSEDGDLSKSADRGNDFAHEA